MLIFGERHLRRVLAQYESHYNGRRPHRGLQLHPPVPDHPFADLSQVRVKRRPVLSGLLNEYERAAYKPRSPQWPSSGTPVRQIPATYRRKSQVGVRVIRGNGPLALISRVRSY